MLTESFLKLFFRRLDVFKGFESSGYGVIAYLGQGLTDGFHYTFFTYVIHPFGFNNMSPKKSRLMPRFMTAPK